LGPGYYEQQSTFDANRNSITAGTNVRQGIKGNFLVAAPRFGEIGKNETPGPGHYSNDDLNGWFKRTYNMIFTE
jgi:hypothetical protein